MAPPPPLAELLPTVAAADEPAPLVGARPGRSACSAGWPAVRDHPSGGGGDGSRGNGGSGGPPTGVAKSVEPDASVSPVSSASDDAFG